MDLGSGEYVIISSCLKSPYDLEKIKKLITNLMSFSVDFDETCYLKTSPSTVSFNEVWEGVEDFTAGFSYDLVSVNVLSSVDMIFLKEIPARLNIMFLDEESYEVSLSLNYSELIEEEIDCSQKKRKCDFLERLALTLFESLNPIYGMLGIESSVVGLKDISTGGVTLPLDKVFFNNSCINDKTKLLEIISSAHFFKECDPIGIYFRYSEVDDFRSFKSEEYRPVFEKLIHLS
ncbi:hypothetical protein [Paenibacillus sp. 1P03SA]|uniref:hypothetical protein n=1 Tax=Paenibacillus sp. 1P03SA TaxID=3132294 RepID=UPI0039A2CF30